MLVGPKFTKRPVGAVERFVAALGAVAEVVPAAPRPWDRVSVDPDDDYLVALARRARVDALVSGDPDLTALTGVDPPVQTPAAFWARIQAGRPGTRAACRSPSRP